MNFGQNLYNWFLSNAQSLVLLAIVVIGLYLGFKREFSKLIGFLHHCDYCGGLGVQRCWSKRHFIRAI
uniref:Conjugative transposon protein n=1 Tax=Clostridioides difficile TaxID=1496 RepID=A0A381I6E9_CLODI|nr:conjugative transposon protein [Clostridioides difficile]